MKAKRLKALALSCLMFMTNMMFVLPVGAAASYPDVNESDWFYEAVGALSENGMINGFPDGMFYPNETLTAAQFFKIVITYVDPGIPTSEAGGSNWAQAYYDYALEYGLSKPGELLIGDLNSPIIRYDAALILSRVVKNVKEETVPVIENISSKITDDTSIPVKYADAVHIVYSAGIIGGYSDGSFKGISSLTRAEAAQMMLRLIDAEKRIDPSAHETAPDKQRTPVGDDWFSDAMFIGDSLTHGFSLFSDLDTPDFYYSTGMSVFTVTSSKLETPSGSEYTLLEALGRKAYKKVFLLLGINELGYSPDEYYAKYGELVDLVLENLPDAQIYIQSILPVSEAMNNESSTFTKKGVDAFNMVLLHLAMNKNARYLDVNSALADEHGFLPQSATWDGIHLNTSYYVLWADYLRATAG